MIVLLMRKLTISEQVQGKRKEAKISQQKLANDAGLSIDTVRAIEQGRNKNPSLFVLKAVQKVLNFKFEI